MEGTRRVKHTDLRDIGQPDWRRALREAIRDPVTLYRRIGLDPSTLPAAFRSADSFPLLVPESFLARMTPGDPTDPLLRQVLPVEAETRNTAGFSVDPVGDLSARRAPGLLHKYAGRALLVVTGACAVHCRYCFRRHYPYTDEPGSVDAFQPALETVAQDRSIHEIILSGGDPLSRPDAWLQELVRHLAAIPHLNTLRIHTRYPVVLPERVGPPMLEWLCGTRLDPVVVLHANHAAELTGDCLAAIAQLRDAQVSLLNQSVLLAGVNDDADALEALSRRLFAVGVLPYYLHQLDPVAGAAHFQVEDERGCQLLAELRKRLPGYLVPRFVREVEGADHKIPLA